METVLNEVKQLTESFMSGLIARLPNLILSVLVIIAGIILGRIARNLTKKFILYLDRVINQKLIAKRITVDLHGSAKVIATSFYWIIILFSVALIIQILELTFLSKWFDGLIVYIPNFVAALLILFTGFIAGKLVSDFIVSITQHTGLAKGKPLGNFIKYTILGISVIIAIDQLGVDIRFLTNLVSIVLSAILFGAALAFGLGAKTSVSNILSSYYFQKTFEIGDTIKMGETEGVITDIMATSVKIETKSGEVIIPAKEFNETITILKKKE